MDDTRQKLISCFQVVFPDMPADEIPAASTATVANWDSVAAITMMNVIEDEFAWRWTWTTWLTSTRSRRSTRTC